MNPRRAAAVLAAAVLAAAAVGSSRALEAGRPAERPGPELMYFPSGVLLRPMALGHPMTMADLLWLRGIQYYGEHRLTDNRFPHAGHIFETITTFDPYFAEAYIFGGLVLASEGQDLRRGLALLERGLAWNPTRWELPFEIGFVHYLALKDDTRAARFFDLARRLPGAPEYVTRFAAHARARTGNSLAALALWEDLLRSTTHPLVRTLAERKVEAIRAELGLPAEPLGPPVPGASGRPAGPRGTGTAGIDGDD